MTQLILPRRHFLRMSAAASGLVLAPALAGCVDGPTGAPEAARLADTPFTLGVAAGDPVPDGFVLWTRLAPEPLSTDPAWIGGMAPAPVPVTWEIGADDGMRAIVKRGETLADPALAHSVHAEVAGLEPGRDYWYRFRASGHESAIGRARTAPAPGTALQHLRLAFASCSNYEQGYFSAYRHMAADAPDLVLFLGDYIYEYVDRHPGTVRRHSDGVEAATLPTYRNRYAQYHLDPDLQALHASAACLMTWDDHEVQNDYADRWSETFDEPTAFLLRRAAAYQAFYEHMPMRPSQRPVGPDARIYGRSGFGDLVEFSVVDGRQYRSQAAGYRPPHGGGHLETARTAPELMDPARTYLGAAQEAWLYDGLARSRHRWNVIAQDVLMARLRQRIPTGEFGWWTDDWDGYAPARTRLLSHVRDSGVANPVVISGDIHSFWTNDLKVDFDDAKAPVVATEFVGTSITSNGPPYDVFAKYLPDNPHVKFFDSRPRGYVLADITPDRMTTQFRALSDVRDPQATVSTLARFVVESGRGGALTA